MIPVTFSLAALALQPLVQPQQQQSSFSRRAILPAIPAGLFTAATQSPQAALAADAPKELTDFTEKEYSVFFKVRQGCIAPRGRPFALPNDAKPSPNAPLMRYSTGHICDQTHTHRLGTHNLAQLD